MRAVAANPSISEILAVVGYVKNRHSPPALVKDGPNLCQACFATGRKKTREQ